MKTPCRPKIALHPRLVLPPLLLLAPLALLTVAGCRPSGFEPQAAASPIPLRSELAEKGPFSTRRTLLGRVEPATRTQVLLPISGRIAYPPRWPRGLRTGETVRRGEVLARIENSDHESAWLEAEVAVRAAQASATRMEKSVEAGVSPAAELERANFELEKATIHLETLHRSREENTLLAPTGGILRLEDTAPAAGSRVEAGALLAELASDGPLEIELWASQQDLEELAVGAKVRCRISGQSEVRGEGTLQELDDVLDASGLARGRARIDEDLGMPRAGSGVEVDIEGPEIDTLTVAETAILRRGGVATLFVLENRGTGYLAHARAVTLGPRGNGRVAVQSGLQAGERVAIVGADLLAEGMSAIEAKADDDQKTKRFGALR